MDLLFSIVRSPHGSAIMKQSSSSRPRRDIELQHIMVAKGPLEAWKELRCCGSTGTGSDQEHQVSRMIRRQPGISFGFYLVAVMVQSYREVRSGKKMSNFEIFVEPSR